MNSKSSKNLILIISLIAILACGVSAAIKMANSAPTYDGTGTDVVWLYDDPSTYDNSGADGVASVMVNENNDKTAADNVVYSVVFNYRGYDTLGESFILIGAIAGTMAILRRDKRRGSRKIVYYRKPADNSKASGAVGMEAVGDNDLSTNQYKRKPVIVRCSVSFLMPLAIVYGWYIVIHGAMSPGGGFQGGVLAAGTVLLVYLAYGLTGVRKAFNPSLLHVTETLSEMTYVFVGLLGIFGAMNFCFNFVLSGSEETAMIMNDAVGYHVMAGICCLLIIMLEALGTDEVLPDNGSDNITEKRKAVAQ